VKRGKKLFHAFSRLYWSKSGISGQVLGNIAQHPISSVQCWKREALSPRPKKNNAQSVTGIEYPRRSRDFRFATTGIAKLR
jgi:hypothetical protein